MKNWLQPQDGVKLPLRIVAVLLINLGHVYSWGQIVAEVKCLSHKGYVLKNNIYTIIKFEYEILKDLNVCIF